jgi:hypothetical protein
MTWPIKIPGPIETKVIAAPLGTTIGLTVGAFIVWLLGVLIWHAPDTADHASFATASVPGPVQALVVFVLGLAGTAIAGYLAPHTPRPPVIVSTERSPILNQERKE